MDDVWHEPIAGWARRGVEHRCHATHWHVAPASWNQRVVVRLHATVVAIRADARRGRCARVGGVCIFIPSANRTRALAQVLVGTASAIVPMLDTGLPRLLRGAPLINITGVLMNFDEQYSQFVLVVGQMHCDEIAAAMRDFLSRSR
jgi:hypothetical protein